MENLYDVGIANRYALFLEEGENELVTIKKKLSKEIRSKNKQEKKENAEAKKNESVKPVDKPKKPEPSPTSDTAPKRASESKENKPENARGKDRKPKDTESNKRDNRDFQDKPRNVKNGQTAPDSENWDDEIQNKTNDSAPPRKNFDNRKPRDRKFDGNDQYQPKSYYNSKKFVKKDNVDSNEYGNGDVTTNNDNGGWGTTENGHDSQPNDYKPRGGGGNRYRGGNRGSRGGYYGGDRGERGERGDRGDRGERGDRSDRGDRNDRRRGYENRYEMKENSDNNKSDTWGEEPVENSVENPDNHNDEKESDSNGAGTEQKEEVKEVMTLDEWKKIRGEREKPQYNLRKAGEGEDLSQWKNMKELTKEKETEFLENGSNSHHVSKKTDNDKENNGIESGQRNARQKHIDIKIHFREPAARGGRGGRIIRNNRFGFKGKNNEERNEGGYNNGEARPNRKYREGPAPGGRGGQRQHAPKITDERDFPTLG